MSEKLEPYSDRLFAAKASFLEKMESVSAENRTRSPESGWNMLQVMEHVIVSDRGTYEYLKRKTQAPAAEIPPASEETRTNSEGLQNALLSEKRWKMPEVLPAPTGAQSYDNLLKFWDQLYTEYHRFLSELDPDYYQRQVFKHPIAGRLDLFQTIEFQINHLVHHGYQLERIKKVLDLV